MLALLLTVLLPPVASGGQEVLAIIQIHGNNATPEAEVLAIAGVSVGGPFTETTIGEVRRRLVQSRRFEGVEVRKRYASIADPSQVALVIVVDEFPVRIALPVASEGDEPDAVPRILRRGTFGGAMFLPILDVEEGYGFTYGAVVAFPGVVGGNSRVSFPLSWGGRKQAAAELERLFARGPFSRVQAGASIGRTRNPAFDEDDDRRRVWGRVERGFGRHLRLGATAGWEQVDFAGDGDRFGSIGADATFDTRLDPGLPRNAVYVHAAWAHLAGDATGATNRRTVDARGYLGLIGQSVLIARIEGETSGRPLPAYFKPMLGGWSNLRGFAAGSFVGDTRVSGSLELRVPVSSALSVGKAGFSVFVDTGKAYDDGVRFGNAPVRTGAGAGVWFTATIVRAGVAVAHGFDHGTRVNFGIGLTY